MIYLKDLIIVRKEDSLQSLIQIHYPYLSRDKIDEEINNQLDNRLECDNLRETVRKSFIKKYHG